MNSTKFWIENTDTFQEVLIRERIFKKKLEQINSLASRGEEVPEQLYSLIPTEEELAGEKQLIEEEVRQINQKAVEAINCYSAYIKEDWQLVGRHQLKFENG